MILPHLICTLLIKEYFQKYLTRSARCPYPFVVLEASFKGGKMSGPGSQGGPSAAPEPFVNSAGFIVLILAIVILAVVGLIVVILYFKGFFHRRGKDGSTSRGGAGDMDGHVPLAGLGGGRYRVIKKIGKG